ncbi:hybrid sensor histidine kinase/response regulator [Burkholderia sp. 4701]|nr:hybrid sensor histidine kinase/response regulator [Burkholderia sp. 4701]MXN83692.1 hybrid sensor histidine kinase/response regulator [Burkholderia sp. 4812]
MRRRHAAWASGCRALLFGLLLACLAHAGARAATTEPAALLEHVSVFEDATAALTVDQVLARVTHAPGSFLPATKARLAPGFSRSAWWLHLTVVNRAGAARALTLALRDARVDRVDFYTLRNGRWTPEAVFPPADIEAFAARARYPVLDVTLTPGEALPVLVRVTSRKAMRFEPTAMTRQAWQANELRAAMWDCGLLGGLLALAWSALLIGFFSRSSAFYLLAALTLCTALYEAGVRGYTRTYLWPDSPEWSARSETLFAYLAIACFIVFVLKIARGEQVRLPVRIAYLVVLALECIGMVGTAFGDLHFFVPFCARLNAGFGILNICIVLLLARRRTPTGRLMLVTVSFGLFNFLVRTIGGLDAVLPALSWLKSDIYPNPVIAIIGLATHLVVLAAWINHVGRQRTEARQRLEHWQLTEQERLRDEVAKRTLALNDALHQANTNMQQKIETLGYVSHDLRAPLSTINGYAKLLLQGATQTQARLIQSIDRSIRYQLTLIDELLEFTKAELQPLGVAPDATDLPGLLDDIGSYAVALCAQQDNRFVHRSLTPLPRTLVIDGTRLQQVLLNLLSNASKFTRNGVVTLSVDARRESDGYRIGIEVADTGIGIDVNGKADIFRAYQQVHAVDGGTGLGLFIAQRIVKAMGGELAVASKPGVGTAFSFQIVARAVGHTLVAPSERARLSSPQADATHAPSRSPSVEALDALARFARNGRLTDVEEWIERHAADAGHAGLLREVQARVDALDFHGIEVLVESLKARQTFALRSEAAAHAADDERFGSIGPCSGISCR